jgi:DNA helicase-2/ATP-dependent DNA helicase PcrA
MLSNEEKLISIGILDPDKVLKVTAVLQQAREMETTEPPHRVLQFILKESGFLDHVLLRSALESSRVVRRLYDEIEEMVMQEGTMTLSGISTVFALRRKHRLPLSAPYINNQDDAVQVMTAHKSKGLEFEVVFIPHLCDSLWGGSAKRSYFDIPQATHIDQSQFDPIDDERRLLYVAMTRAKRKLFLSYSQTNTEGKELTPSRLLADIEPTYVTSMSVEDEEDSFDPVAAVTSALPAVRIDAALLRRHLEEKGLSATSLNNYLRSPWDYLYRNVLHIPEVQEEQLQFGTAIHGVMEWVSAYHAQKGVMPTDTEVKDALERQLSRLPIGKTAFSRLHEKGLIALYAYLSHVNAAFSKHAYTEFSISVDLPTGLDSIPLLPLTGKLDRLDLDEEGNVTLIVDYKTGKPKTRNEIEGNTKSSNGDYKRQLTFYVLLLSLYEDVRYACRTCKLSFIEPDAKGVVHEEVFTITDEEVHELKNELIRVAGEISSGAFLQGPCDPETSSYCHLVASLREM